MRSVSLEEAISLLPQLIQEARAGEDVIITQNNLPMVRLVSTVPTKPTRQPGTAKGLIPPIAEDFDARFVMDQPKKPKPTISPEQITRIIHRVPIDSDLIVEEPER